MNSTFNLDIINEYVQFSQIEDFDIELFIKREDTIHPFISGNKYRKLKYNIIEAQNLNKKTIVTFGGAFSNHIAATAAFGKEFGIDTIGIIRGEEFEFKVETNATLNFARKCGMEFKFVTRADYRYKNTSVYVDKLNKEFEDVYIIPEGGTNDLAIKGCEQILNANDKKVFDYICCSVGTGGTISGLINSSKRNQKILGFPALKDDFLNEDICKFAINDNWHLVTDYRFGGYAKVSSELICFINQFKKETAIQLDPVYTGKMLFGMIDLIKKGFFPKQSKILAIHTGGLQGIKGMNQRLKQKQLPLIH